MLLDDARLALRRTSKSFDAEIINLIEAALDELRAAGADIPARISHETEASPLVNRAVMLYCKAHFGFNDDNERYIKAFEHLKSTLALVGDNDAV